MKQVFGKGLLIVWCLVAAISLQAQDAVQYSQYFSNQMAINPAYAGADDALSVSLIHRNQWTGVSGAPSTTTLTGHTLFNNENTGLGVNLYVDKINIHSEVSFSGIYSYRINTSKNTYLSMGLQAGLNSVRSDYSSLLGSIHDPNDPGLRFERQTTTAFQFGAGVYYKSPKLEFGLSAPVLFSSVSDSPEDSLGRLSTMPHLFIFSTYKFDVTREVEIAPSILMKSRPGSPFAVDINVAATLKDAITVALSYRSFESMSAILQMRILPQMKLGYAYDFPISSVKRRYFNSHEIMINYVFKYNNYNVKSPR